MSQVQNQNPTQTQIATIRKYVKLRHGDLKELSDLQLTIMNFIDVVKEKMSQTWYEMHMDMTLHEFLVERLMWSGKAVFHCPEYEFLTNGFRKCVEERADKILNEVLYDPEHEDMIDFVLELKDWGLEDLTFRELETISTIIDDIIGYCRKRGYDPDDSLDDCFS